MNTKNDSKLENNPLVSWIFGLLAIFYPIIFILIMLLLAFTMSMEGYLVSKTRKRFIEEFNVFAQSLSTKK
jgi:hypothetical protein